MRAARLHVSLLFFFLIFTLHPLSGFAQDSSATQAKAAFAPELPPDLAKAVDDYDRANILGDVTTLSRLFADDYMLVNSDASTEDKRQALADFLVPGFRIDPYVMEHTTGIVWNDGAVVTGIVHLGWSQNGEHHARVLRIAHVWAKRDGQWQMRYTQVTRVPQ